LISVWPGSGSGNSGTPCERMHWEKATSLPDVELLDDPPAGGEPPEPAGDPLLPHAAASSARAAVAMTAAAVRAAGGRARRGQRGTWMLWFIMPSFGAGPWLRPAAGAHPD
jgi:hypothetical protein